MIRCITIGTTTVQGEHVSEGVVSVYGRIYRGHAVPSHTHPTPEAA